jgi:GR25 family glycosyltransferase involved in LPS biosynthesis
MKHYWINIDRCIDRKEFMENQFKQKNIDNFRISAETPETIIDYNIIRNEDSINTTTPEEISCILSHLKAIEQGYNDGDSYFCILEDDLDFANIDFNKILHYVEEAQNKTNENVEILQLYTSGHPVVIQLYNEHFLKDDVIIKRAESYPGAVYYLLSREGARKILDKYLLSKNNYDISYSSWTAADNIIYAAVNSFVLTYPVVVTDIAYGSTLHPEHLPNHEYCNNIIRHIWNVNNQLKLFMK